MTATGIFVVANRLPITSTRRDNGASELSVSPGGLVSALAPVVEQLGCTWVGWHDGVSDVGLDVNGMRLVPVHADPELYDQYYQGFANQVLWPVFHGFSQFTAEPEIAANLHGWWRAYRAMNRAFAARVAEIAKNGTLIWVHDYHLLLVPGLLRRMRPDLRIAVFLHIPFPEIRHLKSWPWASELLGGLAAAHLIGVQREQDAVNLRAARAQFAAESSPLIRAFPISIDVEPFLADARTAQETFAPKAFRNSQGIGNRKMLLSVDRLDYTKGVLERVEAFAEVLETWADDDSRPVLVQVLTPTREDIPAYREYGERVRAALTSLHTRFATSEYSPTLTLAEPLSASELAELYLAADVMCVTPIRDGMNLVAKEFVVSRIDERGVLVLGREAGAADQLIEALTVDTKNPTEMVQTLRQALAMTPDAVSVRMRAMRARVLLHDVHHWAGEFLNAAGIAGGDSASQNSATVANDFAVVLENPYGSTITLLEDTVR